MNDGQQPSDPLRPQIWAVVQTHHAMADCLSDLERAARLAKRDDVLDAVQEMQRVMTKMITNLLKDSARK
jgi:hypothetical protein